MIRLGSTVVIDDKVMQEQSLIDIDTRIFEVIDADFTHVSVRSVPNGTLIIHGLRRTDVVVQNP